MGFSVEVEQDVDGFFDRTLGLHRDLDPSFGGGFEPFEPFR
jgi:hypothetical protein